jgi:hypothetical protein
MEAARNLTESEEINLAAPVTRDFALVNTLSAAS